jgi:hypothetical protein
MVLQLTEESMGNSKVFYVDRDGLKEYPPPSQDKREAAAKEWREMHRAKNRKERRRALAEIRKVERGDYR